MEKSRWVGIIGILLGALVSLLSAELKDSFFPNNNYFLFFIIILTLIFSILFFDLHVYFFDKYRINRRWKNPIMVGVLNGWIDNLNKKKRCTITNYPFEEWKTELDNFSLNGRKKFNTNPICIKQLSNKYAIIINPFGEIHLDENRRTLYTLYNKIFKFIQEGGIYVCTGGIPFYYVWHEILGDKFDTTPLVIDVDQGRISQFRHFYTTIFTKEFGVKFNGLPSQIVTVNQNPEDIQYFGNLINVGGSNQINDFRSALEKKYIIPALRANINDSEVYPLFVVPYDNGYLMVTGMSLQSNVEFLKLVNALSNFSDYLINNK